MADVLLLAAGRDHRCAGVLLGADGSVRCVRRDGAVGASLASMVKGEIADLSSILVRTEDEDLFDIQYSRDGLVDPDGLVDRSPRMLMFSFVADGAVAMHRIGDRDRFLARLGPNGWSSDASQLPTDLLVGPADFIARLWPLPCCAALGPRSRPSALAQREPVPCS